MCWFHVNGYRYSSMEQYSNAQKFYIPDSPEHMEYFDIIRSADSPTKILMLGQQKCKGGYCSKWVVNKRYDLRTVNDVIRQYKHLKIRSDWYDVVDAVILEGKEAAKLQLM